MKFDPFLSDEPSIAPPTPGAALVRLSQVIGKCNALPPGAALLSNTVPNLTQKLASARETLLQALETGHNLGPAFHLAQQALRELYQNIAQAPQNGGDAALIAQNLLFFGFPDPRTIDEASPVAPVEAKTVVATHFKPLKQVFTTLSFAEAHGATAYWLFEIRFLASERFVDAVVENYAPQFSRVRLPVGPHRLLIESRNAHRAAHSAEFDLLVPDL